MLDSGDTIIKLLLQRSGLLDIILILRNKRYGKNENQETYNWNIFHFRSQMPFRA